VFPFAFKRLIHRLSREPTLLLKHAGIGRFVIALVAVLVIDSLIGAIGYHIALWGLPPPPLGHELWLLFNPFFYPLMSLKAVRRWYVNTLRALYPSYSVTVEVSIIPQYILIGIPEHKYIPLTIFHIPLLIPTLIHAPYFFALSDILALIVSWFEGRIKPPTSGKEPKPRERMPLKVYTFGIILLILGGSLVAASFIPLSTTEQLVEDTFELEAGSYRLMTVSIVPKGWEERMVIRGVFRVVKDGGIKFWKDMGFVGEADEWVDFYFENIEWQRTEMAYQCFKLKLGGNFTGPIYFMFDNTHSQTAKTVYFRVNITRIRSCRYLEGPGFMLWMAGIIGIAVSHTVSSKALEQASF